MPDGLAHAGRSVRISTDAEGDLNGTLARVVLEVLIIYGLLGGGFAAVSLGVGWTRYRAMQVATDIDRIWRAYAAERHLEFEPSYGSWYDRRMPRLRGHAEGVTYMLDPMEFNSESLLTPAGHQPRGSIEPYTLASVTLPRPVEGLLVVFNRARSNTIERPLGFRDIDMSDAEFASNCVVWAENDALAQTFLDARTRKALVRLCSRGFVMTLLDGAIWIRWPGFETDTTVLDAAREAVVALGRTHFEDPFGGMSPKG